MSEHTSFASGGIFVGSIFRRFERFPSRTEALEGRHSRWHIKSGLALAALAVPSVSLAQNETAETLTVEEIVTIGDDTTRPINTYLDVSQVPTTGTPLYIGNTTQFADAITIDSGSNFPPGIAFRRYLGEGSDPQPVTPGTQLGYFDFRGYSDGLFYNAASFDVVVDGLMPSPNAGIMATKMRFAVSDGTGVSIPMELRANGRLELGAVSGDNGANYVGPAFTDPRFYVNSQEGKWGALFAANSTTSPNYALRTYSATANATDYLIGGSSGSTGTLVFSVRGNGDTHVGGQLFVGTTNVGASLAALDSDVATIAAKFGASPQAGSVALGMGSRAISANSTAIGKDAIATGSNALAVGNGTRANGASAVAHGDNAISSAPGAIAFGSSSVSTGASSAALGQNARALRDNALAAGSGALAQALNGTAVGSKAVVIAENATAVGALASATHVGSTAVGVGAATTAPNQVVLGGAGTSVKVGDLAASSAAQVGPVDVVTVDQSGTLGRQQVATQASVEAVRMSMDHIAAVSDEQFSALSDRVSGIAGQLDTLFELNRSIDKDAQRGIAAIAAMSHPHFPSGSGKTSYASNVAVYRGEIGLSAGVMHRFDGDFALTAGATYAGGNSAAVRAGVAGEF